MPNTHGYVNTTHCGCWDIDSYNCAGVATSDLDNGVLVSLGTIAQSTTGNNITGYQFTVAPPDAATATGLWIISTPEVGSTLDMQLYSDPRYFHNPAGQPMSLKYLQAGVDCIEVDINCFTGSTFPTATNLYVPVTASTGKLGTPASSAPASGTYFTFVGNHTVDVGQTLVNTVVLRCARN